MRGKSLPTVRFIDPANIEIGDVIRVAWTAGGIEHTRTARVASRQYEGQVRVLYSAEGTEIMHWIPGQRNARVTLLEKALAEPPPMLDIFDNDRVKEALG